MIFGVVLVPAFYKFFDKLDSRIVFATVLLFFRTDIDVFQNIIRRTQRNVYHMSTTRLYRYSFSRYPREDAPISEKLVLEVRIVYRPLSSVIHTRRRSIPKTPI